MKHRIGWIAFLLLLAAGYLWSPLSLAITFCILTVIWISFTAYAVYNIRMNWFVKSIHRLSNTSAIALTFDDGPHPLYTRQILTILREHNIKATFFLIGKEAELYPEVVQQIVHEGHIIGNHSYSHHYSLGFMSKQRLQEDISKCSEVLSNITKTEIKYFRPPFGVTNPRYESVLKDTRLQSIGWSIRSYDTVINDSMELFHRVRKQIDGGKIVLLHDNQAVTVLALPKIIQFCKDKEVNFDIIH